MTGFSDEVMVAIIGGIALVLSTAIPSALEYRSKRLDADSNKQSKITVTGNQAFASKRRKKGFRFSYRWIPVGIAALTLIIFLGVQHEARQNVKKILADSPEFHMNMGDQYAAMGDFAGAELEYYEAIEDDNSDALAHDKRAVALAKDGRLEEALEENLTACALAPDVAQYHNNKGVTLWEMGNHKSHEGNKKESKQHWKNAVEAYKTAIDLDSTIADYHYNLSNVLFSISDIDNAISECKIALQLNSDKSEYHSLYAACVYQKGQYEDALNEAQKAIEKDNSSVRAYWILGQVLTNLNQFDEALSVFRQAIQLNPDNGAVHAYLGIVLDALGRYREAFKEHEISIGLTHYPYEQSIAYYNAADILVALNRYEEALQYIEKAIELRPDFAEAHYSHYALLTYFNRHEEAEQELQAAYDLAGIPLPEEYA